MRFWILIVAFVAVSTKKIFENRISRQYQSRKCLSEVRPMLQTHISHSLYLLILAPAGMLPRSVEVALEADLVDCCKPGDRISVVGIYRALPSKNGGETLGFFKSVILANSVTKIGIFSAEFVLFFYYSHCANRA